MTDFAALEETLRPAEPKTFELFVAANGRERDSIKADLRDQGRDDVYVLLPGEMPVGQRFRRIYVSMTIHSRMVCCEKRFDQWFNEQVRTRLTHDGEIVQTR